MSTVAHFTEELQPTDGGRLSKFNKRLAWTLWNKQETKRHLEELERIKGLLNMWLAVDIWDVGQQLQNDHTEQRLDHDRILTSVKDAARDQKQHHDAAKREKIIEWMSPLNFFQRQADIFSTLQPGTGEWLLADSRFQDWLSGFGKILWCRGMPGSGKTVLASLVINHLEARFSNDGIGVACIYLNHKESETQSLTNLLAGIWRQLVLHKCIPDVVENLYERHRERQTRPSLDDFVGTVNFAVAQYSKVHLVVDALDEYPEVQRNLLLEYLATMGCGVNLMITSRPHISLDGSFPNFKMQTLEIRATEDDIRKYTHVHILRSPRLSKHARARPELCDEIETKIISNVQGMFLLAKLHIESLTTKNTVKAVWEALQHLPKDLKLTYDEIMERIDRQNEEDRQLAHLALTWVANAKRPLSVAELREALAIEPGAASLDNDNLLDLDIIISVCAGLITVDVSTVRLIHYTTQQYLDSIQADRFPDAQTEITSRCLTYMSFKEFSALPGYWEGIGSHKLIQQHPLLLYAQYCLIHATGQPEVVLQSRIIEFLQQACRWRDFWRMCHSWSAKPDHELVAPWTYPQPGWPSSASPLWIAAASNLQTITRSLLSQMDGDIEHSALYGALYYGHLPMLRLLIEGGADVNAKGGEYGTTLHAASYWGQEAAALLLIEAGAELDALGKEECGTPLQAASYAGHDAIAQLLVEKGADVNNPGRHRGSALHVAALNGHDMLARRFIEMGAGVNIATGYYATALQAAALRGHESVVRLLLEKGANVNTQGGPYGTALQAAAYEGHHGVVQLLIEKGANVNAQGGRYGSAVNAASYEGHEAIVRILIQKGADRGVCTNRGRRYRTVLGRRFGC
ncbi:Ankyrin repeat-containing protein [Mycena venus]|uniref:Ankyrin repeat-containing protein n=1 Tax=Mycena venus TaxID=2733690 RepID=A0A8H6XVA5_9AGAR|nr:Ankyrin repeat-containing protein [Mycena venus]